MRSRVYPLGLILSAAFALGLAGCGGAKDTTGVANSSDTTAASMLVSPASDTLVIGDSLELAALVYNVDVTLIPNAPVTWTTADSTIATVSDSGDVVARAAGTVGITGTSGAASAVATIVVIPPTTKPLGSLTVIAAGFSHTCAIGAAGVAYCWGSNASGQLGNDTTSQSALPLVVPGGHTFSTIAAGYAHTCALTPGGTAYCWGANANGQLGIGSEGASVSTPTAVTGGLTFTMLSAGYVHTCGLTAAGAAYCWGADESGELGDGTAGTDQTAPTAVAGGLTFATISAGAVYTCGVTTAGAGYCWGSNGYGVLGDGTTTDRYTPVAVAGGLTLTTISAGVYHTCGLTTSGVAYCWGNAANGQLGTGLNSLSSSMPLVVAGGLTFSTIATGELSTCAVTPTGAVYCWGAGTFGDLASASTASANQPQMAAGTQTLSTLTAGLSFHTCGLSTDGGAYCWGYNDSGELGDAYSGGYSTVPKAVVIPIGQ
jgi:alpha-tubulin suppressor-like RCC1 family protein